MTHTHAGCRDESQGYIPSGYCQELKIFREIRGEVGLSDTENSLGNIPLFSMAGLRPSLLIQQGLEGKLRVTPGCF